MKSWLAAYVRLHHEKKTRDRLTAMGIECFLPIQEEIHQWSDRRKKVERVVIPMMIFVRVSDEERGLPLTLSAISRYMVLLEGELVTVDGKSKVVVRLDMLGCAQVDMSAGFVEKIQI